MAKCALNMQTKALAAGFKKTNQRIAIISLEPGYIPTRVTRFRGTDDIVDRIEALTNVIENLSLEQSGRFKDSYGNDVPF
jgi:NAD(P)-dependent dehydrogenase (short-subunit alcohol dehydrogenase family)